MGASERFDRYMSHLSEGLGHLDRHAGLKGYCTGLMLPLARKSVEPMAARVDPMHASARHQSLHHFVAQAEWSDREMLRRVCQWVVPQMDFQSGGWWIIDDTGFPKKGKHSVGVARQYCGMLDKQDNCQVAVSVSLACDQGSIPVAWQLYLPEDWAADPVRRAQAGVPEELRFATKTQIVLAQLRALLAEGAPHHCVLADAGYGVDTAFRQALSDMGLEYAVGVTSAVVVWPPGFEPLPPHLQRHGPPAVHIRRAARAPRRWQRRESSTAPASVAAHRVAGGRCRAEQVRPVHTTRRHADQRTGRRGPSALAHRARLPGLEAGLRTRSLRGPWLARVPHHASLSIAAYGFLMAERLIADKPVGGKKTSSNAKCLPFPRITSRAAVLRAQHSITTLRLSLSYALIARLGQCSCCGRVNAKLLL
jgi:SRSO17 transposase